MGLTNASEEDVLEGLFTILGTGGTLWVGLSSTTPTATGTNVTEPSGGGYARQAITVATFAAAVGGAPAVMDTDTLIDFGTASGTWVAGANLTHVTFHSAVTAGTVKAWGALTTPKPVLSGDPVSIPIGDLTFRLGDPADF